VIEGFRAALPKGENLRLRQQFGRPNCRPRARSRCDRPPRDASGQGSCADVEADVYLLVYGDATYDAPSARMMVERLMTGNLDMVVGARAERGDKAYRRIGNRLLTGFVAIVFGWTIVDMLSGFRVFSRRFVKSFPILSGGFEIETEMTACTRARPADRRATDAVLRAAPRLPLQAQHLARWFSHPGRDTCTVCKGRACRSRASTWSPASRPWKAASGPAPCYPTENLIGDQHSSKISAI